MRDVEMGGESPIADQRLRDARRWTSRRPTVGPARRRPKCSLSAIRGWCISTVLSLAVVMLGCSGAHKSVATRDNACAGYACTSAGALTMLADLVRRSGKSFRGAELELDKLLDRAVRTMGERGYTPETFQIAAQSMSRFLESSQPMGAEATAAREVERVNRSTHWICPLWPLC